MQSMQKDTIRSFSSIKMCKGLQPEVQILNRHLHVDTIPLLLGPSGVGKNELAKYVHYNSHRKYGPFIEVNCASIPEDRFEAEMFGWQKGSFTTALYNRKGYFQMAHNGTLFLDEIAEFSTSCQAKMLSAIETKTILPLGAHRPINVDCRIMAATNADLKEMLKRDSILEPFFWRIWEVPIRIKSLNDRKSDIPLLINYFLEKYSSGKLSIIEPDAQKMLLYYSWPGNVRQLKNTIKRAVAESENKIITVELIKPWLAEFDDISYDLKSAIGTYEKRIIESALVSKESIKNAARFLDIPYSTLKSKCKKYNIKPSSKHN